MTAWLPCEVAVCVKIRSTNPSEPITRVSLSPSRPPYPDPHSFHFLLTPCDGFFQTQFSGWTRLQHQSILKAAPSQAGPSTYLPERLRSCWPDWGKLGSNRLVLPASNGIRPPMERQYSPKKRQSSSSSTDVVLKQPQCIQTPRFCHLSDP